MPLSWVLQSTTKTFCQGPGWSFWESPMPLNDSMSKWVSENEWMNEWMHTSCHVTVSPCINLPITVFYTLVWFYVYFLFVKVGACHRTHVQEVRRQFVWLSSLLPLCGIWGLNLEPTASTHFHWVISMAHCNLLFLLNRWEIILQNTVQNIAAKWINLI